MGARQACTRVGVSYNDSSEQILQPELIQFISHPHSPVPTYHPEVREL